MPGSDMKASGQDVRRFTERRLFLRCKCALRKQRDLQKVVHHMCEKGPLPGQANGPKALEHSSAAQRHTAMQKHFRGHLQLAESLEVGPSQMRPQGSPGRNSRSAKNDSNEASPQARLAHFLRSQRATQTCSKETSVRRILRGYAEAVRRSEPKAGKKGSAASSLLCNW